MPICYSDSGTPYFQAQPCPNPPIHTPAPGNPGGGSPIIVGPQGGQPQPNVGFNPFPQLNGLFDTIGNPDTWKHLGILIAGFVLLVVGLIVFATDKELPTIAKAV